MKIYKIAQYQTKDGIPITFKELPFNENKDDRGWVVHRIEAYINGENAGYINLSYIPKEKWNSIYKGNLWKFRQLALGHSDVPDNLLDATDKEIADHYEKVYESWAKGGGEYWVKNEKKKAQEEYKMYELYFVDKPIVDFIRTNEKFQRQRVAYALHQYANQWLKDNFGLKLWLSYCRTDQGKCFYDTKLLELKKYRYRTKMVGGYRQTREYMAGNKSWYKKSKLEQNFPPVLSRDELEDFILNNNLRDWSGKLEYQDAHEIAGSVDKWVLTEIPLDSFTWVTDPKYRNLSKKFPPIVILDDGQYEVLDGKHRIGMAKALGQKTMKVYLGEFKDELV